MASYLKPEFTTLKAEGDLSAKQFHFVKHGADDDHVVAAGAGQLALAVLMNAPVAEEPAELAHDEGCKVKLAGTVARGGEIMSDAAGKGVAATATNYVVAIAMESGVNGDVISAKKVLYKI